MRQFQSSRLVKTGLACGLLAFAASGAEAAETATYLAQLHETRTWIQWSWDAFAAAEYKLLLLAGDAETDRARREGKQGIELRLGANLSRAPALAARVAALDPVRCAPDDRMRCEVAHGAVQRQAAALADKHELVSQLLAKPFGSIRFSRVVEISRVLSDAFAEGASAAPLTHDPAPVTGLHKAQGRIARFEVRLTGLISVAPAPVCAAARAMDAALDADERAMRDAIDDMARAIRSNRAARDEAVQALAAAEERAARLSGWRTTLAQAYAGQPCRFLGVDAERYWREIRDFRRDQRKAVSAL